MIDEEKRIEREEQIRLDKLAAEKAAQEAREEAEAIRIS